MRSEQQAPTQALPLQRFLELVDKRLDPSDPDSLWELRGELAALALDPSWVYDLMIQTVEARRGHTLNGFQPSYFIAHRDESFTLRANLWLPERTDVNVAQLENAAFSYDYPHDHNFDILSVTCLGAGYHTDVYEHLQDPDGLDVGAEIDVKYRGRLHQPPLMAFMYEKHVDIHTQLPPDDVVMTLNLLPHDRKDFPRGLYLFEGVTRDKLRVLGRPSSPEGRTMSALRIMAKVRSLTHKNNADRDYFFTQMLERSENPVVCEMADEMKAALGRGAEAVDAAIEREIGSRAAVLKYYDVAERARLWRDA